MAVIVNLIVQPTKMTECFIILRINLLLMEKCLHV